MFSKFDFEEGGVVYDLSRKEKYRNVNQFHTHFCSLLFVQVSAIPRRGNGFKGNLPLLGILRPRFDIGFHRVAYRDQHYFQHLLPNDDR